MMTAMASLMNLKNSWNPITSAALKGFVVLNAKEMKSVLEGAVRSRSVSLWLERVLRGNPVLRIEIASFYTLVTPV